MHQSYYFALLIELNQKFSRNQIKNLAKVKQYFLKAIDQQSTYQFKYFELNKIKSEEIVKPNSYSNKRQKQNLSKKFYFFEKISQKLQIVHQLNNTTSEMYIQIVLCSEKYLKPNEKCASQQLVDEFFKQALNTVVMQVHYKSLDSKDGSEQTSLQEFYSQIEMKNCYTLSTFLSSNLYEVQDAFLFGNPKYVEYIVGSSIQSIFLEQIYLPNLTIQSQTNTMEYCKQTYEGDILTIFYIMMKGNQTKTIFQYPHAGDLLANIGSIVSVLFMIKHAIIVYSNKF